MDLIVGPDGTVRFGKETYPGAVGRSGISPAKREGDGATPAGAFPLRAVLYRPDRLPEAPDTACRSRKSGRLTAGATTRRAPTTTGGCACPTPPPASACGATTASTTC